MAGELPACYVPEEPLRTQSVLTILLPGIIPGFMLL